ncbi:MAG: septal ring lytic transglycosylase RlpA family protein [Alphaproteobacteria bacterium]|nr:septal ring lytic transglycosylase RlpA family protein [Alphaproteobacteria bacterium]
MYLKKILCLSCAFCLFGCSDNGFLFRSVGSYNQSKSVGTYLVGAPYEINGVVYTPKEDYDYFDSGDAFWYSEDKNHPLTANGEIYDKNKMTAMHKTLPLPSIVKITNLNNQMSAFVRVNDRGPFDNNRIMDVSEATARYLNFSKTKVTPIQIEIMVLESQKLKEQLNKTHFNRILSLTDTSQKETSTKITQGETILDSDKILYPGLKQEKIENLKLKQMDKDASSFKTLLNKQTLSDTLIQPKKNAVLYAGSGKEGYYVQIGAFSKEKSVHKIRQKLKAYDNLKVKDKYKNGQLLHYVRIGPLETQNKALKILDKIHNEGYADATIIFE